MATHRSLLLSAFLALLAQTAPGQQTPGPATPTPVGAAERYDAVFAQLQKLAPRDDRVAAVHHLILQRDAITLRLDEGTLYVATPVGERTVGAVFVGHGSVAFAPPVAIERHELKRVLGDSTLDQQISAVALLFTDTTLAQLEHQLSFGAGAVPGAASSVLSDALDHLIDGGARALVQPTLMSALLNGETDGFFYAHVKRERGEDLMFVVDPQEEEAIELLRSGREGDKIQIVCQFKAADRPPDRAELEPLARGPLALATTHIDATIKSSLAFSAAATLGVTARHNVVRWVRFQLYRELRVDSIWNEGGTANTFFQADRGGELWVRFDPALRTGETRTFHIAYHGDAIGWTSLMGDIVQEARKQGYRGPGPAGRDTWYFVKDREHWYPRYAPRRVRYGDYPPVTMELTFHTPEKLRFQSVGRLVESHTADGVVTTRWVTERPVTEACFSLGELEEYEIRDPRIPPVTVEINGAAHRQLGQLPGTAGLFLGQNQSQRDVGADVANSLAFFTRVYGPPLFSHYVATESPVFYGQAFPGLMYLSFATYQTFVQSGGEETFRAHEMAHQWWGIGVEPAGYRDIWMSEGFAEFSGLWYMQQVLMDNEKFFKQLKERRMAIGGRRHSAPPLALGWRVGQSDVPRDYQLMIYYKGAWVLHMLRNMMIDLHTMKEDAFTAMMRDFYARYRGRSASTADFQKVVEEHVGISMDWFFHEWVDGTAIPTYVLSWHAEPADGGAYTLQLRVRQEDVPSDFEMPVPIQIELANESHALARVNVRGPLTELSLRLPAEPKQVELNPLESVLAEVKTEGWP